MTLTDNIILAIYLTLAYTGLSFAWFWLRWKQLENDEEGFEAGRWFDWVLCIPVLLLAGILGIFHVIFSKSE